MFHVIAQYFIAIVSTGVVGVELWTGQVFAGWRGNDITICRDKHPGPYWANMALHFIVVAVVIFVLFFM